MEKAKFCGRKEEGRRKKEQGKNRKKNKRQTERKKATMAAAKSAAVNKHRADEHVAHIGADEDHHHHHRHQILSPRGVGGGRCWNRCISK